MKKKHWSRPECEWSDDDLLSDLRQRYEPREIPFEKQDWDGPSERGDSEVLELIRRYEDLARKLRYRGDSMVDISLPGSLAVLRMRVSDLLPRLLGKVGIRIAELGYPSVSNHQHEDTVNKEKYPECAKLSKVREKSAALSEFVDWLNDQGIILCSYSGHSGEYEPQRESYERLFARFFEVDLEKVEAERRAMIEELSR